MKIALVQPFWSDNEDCKHLNDPWNEDALVGHLKHVGEVAGDVDLVVFPECYPWSGDNVGKRLKKVTLEFMKERMAAVSLYTGRTFIAGGLVLEGEDTSNVVMLASPGSQCLDEHVYRKRLPWEGESITPGEIERDALFKFGPDQEYAVIPLICADVVGAAWCETPQQVQDHQAIVNGARDRMNNCSGAPIVVCAYAGGTRTNRWRERLATLVEPLPNKHEQRLDLVFCNLAGHDGVYGGGGSRLISSRDTSRLGPRNPGVCICDLGANPPTQEFNPYHLPR